MQPTPGACSSPLWESRGHGGVVSHLVPPTHAPRPSSLLRDGWPPLRLLLPPVVETVITVRRGDQRWPLLVTMVSTLGTRPAAPWIVL